MLKDILKKMKIKNPILLLLFIPLVSFGQEIDTRVLVQLLLNAHTALLT